MVTVQHVQIQHNSNVAKLLTIAPLDLRVLALFATRVNLREFNTRATEEAIEGTCHEVYSNSKMASSFCHVLLARVYLAPG